MSKFLKTASVALAVSLVALSTACAKIPGKNGDTSTNGTTVRTVPLPDDIENMDSSKLVPSASTQNCRKAPALTTATSHKTGPLFGGGEIGTYSWPSGVTNGQIWKTQVAYERSSLASVRIQPTIVQIGAIGDQKKLAAKIDAIAYINGDFFHLRASNLLKRPMVDNGELVFTPSTKARIVGVVEVPANERTGLQGASYIKVGKTKIPTQGLNLSVLDENGISAFNSFASTKTFPTVAYVVTAKAGKVTSSGAATTFSAPTAADEFVFVANGTGVKDLQALKVGAAVSYTAPKNALTTKFIRTELSANGKVTLADGSSVPIVAVNNKLDKVTSGIVLFTELMYPSTSRLGATIVTDTTGKVLKISIPGVATNVATGNYVLQVGQSSVSAIKSIKVGDKLKIDNTYSIPTNLKLFSAFGDNEVSMIDGIDVAKCNSFNEQIRPRTAMGWNENGDVWFATTTMGVRNAADVFNRYRVGGSTVHQLVEWLKEMGATQAVALDGGGSTTMYAKESDGTYKRIDLPATEWVRAVPQGIGMVVRQ